MTEIYDFFTYVSMAMTHTTVNPAVYLIMLFWPHFKEAYSKPSADRSKIDWMVIGVFISFFGQIFDNVWWAFAWTSKYINEASAMTTFFFDNGTISNVFFRQACGSIAAYCHIKSVLVGKTSKIKRLFFISLIVGLLHVYLMMLVES